MVVKVPESLNEPKNYVLSRKSGRSIIERRPVFSPDGESLVIIVENTLRVYNIHTGDWVRSLETETPVSSIISAEFPEHQNYNLYGCSNNGLLTTWTWENGAVLREIKLKIPYNNQVRSFNIINETDCLLLTAHPMKGLLHMGLYNYKTGALNIEYVDTKVPKSDILSVSIGMYYGEPIAAIVSGYCKMHVQNLVRPDKNTLVRAKYRLLAVSMTKGGAIAATDTLGRTIVYRGNVCEYINVGSEVLHWHALPLYAVHFSKVGSYILTGGMEKVLVKWTIGSLAQRANEKKFIPRLPGFIRYITTSNDHVAITLSNNSVVIANMQLHVTTTILECGGLSSVTRSLGSSLVYHKKLSSLIVPGRTGYLQLYSTTTDKVLYNIDITEVNHIPSERYNILPVETEVTCAAISANGFWLVTSEYRYDGTNYPEEKLKFWSTHYNSASAFKLNTCVNLSHGGCDVVSIALNKRGDFCVTAGNDQKFRIWKFAKEKGKNRWLCLTACYYSSGIAHYLANPALNEFKHGDILGIGTVTERPYLSQDRIENDIVQKVWNIHKTKVNDRMVEKGCYKGENAMGGVAVSQDGSLIAAWFGSKLTLWDSHLCNLRTTLSHPALRPKGREVQFGNMDAAHYLVCTTDYCLAVWSLLSLTMKWMVQNSPTCLVADPFSNRMMVVNQDNDLFVFTPHDSTPILSRKRILNPEEGVIRQCAFGNTTRTDVTVYLMRNNSELYSLEPERSSKKQLEAITHRNLPTSKFSTLLAEQQVTEVTSSAVAEIQQMNQESLGHKATSLFLSSSSYMVPPVTSLSTSFLELISGCQEVEEIDEQTPAMEVDQDSSDDDEMPKISAPKPEQLCKANYEKIKEKKLKKLLENEVLDLNVTADVFGL
ncbi:unnamed protein product [Colias eurytheme]|nr:unnamed protein product [Colias eurytheme]